MQLLRKLRDISKSVRGGALAIGNFDGVHCGHRSIVQRLIEHARAVEGPAVIFTFDPHPVRLLRPLEAPPPLTWTDRKADLLAELGVTAMIAYPTDRELLELECRQFFQTIVIEALQAKVVVEGPNFFFGKNRVGDVQRLRALCDEYGLYCDIVPPVQLESGLVSSSRIRELLRAGHVTEARAMLGYPYRLRGLVVHGAARGARIGFPTANLDGIDTLTPGHGIYAGRAQLEGRWHPAAIHIGPSPTFGDALPRVEVHLIDFEQSIYGRLLEVEFWHFMRHIETFADEQQLVTSISRDIDHARELLQDMR
ncbi:MAG TPA: bifunctional riboflavin kinase/FAD synthetase [Pirellulaceae bacterium]|nr:bifunctional riboflavin kinase/FAD synthetase [Pirellulaceae bacterium]